MTAALFVMFLANIILFAVNFWFARDNTKACDDLIKITEKHCKEMQENREEWMIMIKEWREIK
jgi:hypothetical protein